MDKETHIKVVRIRACITDSFRTAVGAADGSRTEIVAMRSIAEFAQQLLDVANARLHVIDKD